MQQPLTPEHKLTTPLTQDEQDFLDWIAIPDLKNLSVYPVDTYCVRNSLMERGLIEWKAPSHPRFGDEDRPFGLTATGIALARRQTW